MSDQYPACPLTEDYPLLICIPPGERAAWIEQAEAGIPLTAEQNAALGMHPSLLGGVLLPARASRLSQQQLEAISPKESRKVLGDIMRLGMVEERENEVEVSVIEWPEDASAEWIADTFGARADTFAKRAVEAIVQQQV